MRVAKDVLLQRLKENRDKHQEVYEEAMEGWKRAFTKKLQDALEKLTNGESVEPSSIYLQKPRSHTDEYDKAVCMIEASLDLEFELRADDFDQYFCDNWSWKEQFVNNATDYGAKLGRVRR